MACKQRALLFATYLLVLRRTKLDRKLKVINVLWLNQYLPKKRAEWEKLVKEVNNDDREYSLRYLWMSLERFEDLFSFAAPHCAKNVQIRSFFWSLFSSITGKFGPEKTPYLGAFYAVLLITYSEILNLENFDWKL